MEALLALSVTLATTGWALSGCCEKVDIDDTVDEPRRRRRRRHRRRRHRGQDFTFTLNLHEKPKKPDTIAEQALQALHPKEMPKDEKQVAIEKGKQCGEHEYPTMEDVMSDWKSPPRDKKEPKKKGNDKKDKKAKAPKPKAVLVLPKEKKKGEEGELSPPVIVPGQ